MGMKVQVARPGIRAYIAVKSSSELSAYGRTTYLVMRGPNTIVFCNYPDGAPMFTANFDHFERQLDKALDEPAKGKTIDVTVKSAYGWAEGEKLRLIPTTRDRNIIQAPCGARYHVKFGDLDEVYRLLPELRDAG